MELKEARPPFVQFRIVQVQDRERSIESGQYVAKDGYQVLVTPQGSKDKHEAVAEEWIAKKQKEADDGMLPAEWVDAWKRKFAMFKEGQSIDDIEGTPLKNWPVMSPGHLATCLAFQMRSVEDLAHANEESVLRLGMGGRSLQQKAREWLKSTGGEAGKQAEKIVALELANAQLAETNKSMQEQLSVMSRQLEQLLPKAAAAAQVAEPDAPAGDIGDIFDKE